MTEEKAIVGEGLSDGDLLAAFLADRRNGAFAKLVRRHGPLVLGVCRSVLGPGPDAEDAAQAVFLTLVHKARSLRGHPTLAGWLHRVAWYVARRAQRATQIRQRHEREAARMKQQQPGNCVRTDDLPLEWLHAGLAALPEKYRLPLILHHLEGRTQAEVAELVGSSVGAVSVRLTRGRQMLRARIEKRGGAAGAPALLAALSPHVCAAVSPAFVAAATSSAAATLAGQLTASTAASAQALALSKGAMNMLFWTKVKIAALVTAAVLLVGGGAGSYVALAGPAALDSTTKPYVFGSITQVAAGSVTIQPSTGQAVAVAFDGTTTFTINNKPGDATGLATGMHAGAWGQVGQVATRILAYTPPAPPPPPTPPAPTAKPYVFGSITQVAAGSVTIQPSSGQAVAVAFDGTTTFTINGKSGGATGLATGMHAGAYGQVGQVATKIVAYTPAAPPAPPTPPAPPAKPYVYGTITQVGATSVTIAPPTGQAVSVAFDATTTFTINGSAGGATGLQAGMRAAAFGQVGQVATKIIAYTPKPTTAPNPPPTSSKPYIFGTVIQAGETGVTIQPTGGAAATVTFDSHTTFTINGKPGGATGLQVGMHAGAYGTPGQPAASIMAYMPKTGSTK